MYKIRTNRSTSAPFLKETIVRISDDTVVYPTDQGYMDFLASGGVPDHEDEETIQSIKPRLVKALDDYIGEIYLKFERFGSEYRLREEAAQTYKDSNYTGIPPTLVIGFAIPAGLSARSAADTILAQAMRLRGAIPILGNLRMRKYDILKATSIDSANDVYNSIKGDVDVIASQL